MTKGAWYLSRFCGSLRNYPIVGPRCDTGTARTVYLLRTGPFEIKIVRTYQ
jgi:hypothetical protein